MQPLTDRGVPPGEHGADPVAVPSLRTMQDWDGIRLFLQVVRHGSFRSAAEGLGQSVNALRRHVQELERQLGVTLLTRHVDGIRITEEGKEIFAVAQRMETAAFGLVRARDRVDPAICGEVRLAVTEGLGTFWIAPRVVEFQRSYPKLLIDMSCAMHSADVLRMEADVSLQLTRPTSPDLKLVKVGRLHAIPYAAQSYVERYGAPTSIPEMLRHRLCIQVAQQVVDTMPGYDQLFPGVPQPGFVAIRNNVSSAHYWSIAKGAGIGLLPTYASAIGAAVMPLDIPGVYFPSDIWMAYHPDAARIPRVRRLLDWVIESFDSQKFPWFRDEFIHPRDLPQGIEGEAAANMFAGFGREPVRPEDRDSYYAMTA